VELDIFGTGTTVGKIACLDPRTGELIGVVTSVSMDDALDEDSEVESEVEPACLLAVFELCRCWRVVATFISAVRTELVGLE
jgi:hypothetical protein